MSIFNKYKSVISNMSWMYLLQIANYIFPLLIIPYLLRTIGPDKYGIIVLAQSITGYLGIVVDYGFNLTATRDIANNQHNIIYIRKVYNLVMQCKIFIILIIFIFWIFGLSIGYLYYNIKPAFWMCSFTIILGQLMNPIFFFQGIEKMKYIAMINVISRGGYLLLLLIIVKKESDYFYVTGFQGISSMIAGFIALLIIHKNYQANVSFTFELRQIKEEIKKGSPIFISNCCGNVYTQGSAVLVNLIAGNIATTYFSLASKVSSIVCQIVQPVVQSIYPRLCQRFENGNFTDVFRILYTIGIISSLIACLVTYICAPFVSKILCGDVDDILIFDIHISTFMMFFIILNIIIHPCILASGSYRFVQKLYLYVSVLFLAISSILTYYYQQEGMLMSLMLVELIIAIFYRKRSHKILSTCQISN